MALETIHYTEILGNRFNLKPRVEMLRPEGWLKPRMVSVERQVKEAQQLMNVHYDTEYVIGYFARQMEHLRELTSDEIRAIIGKSKKESKRLFD